MSCLPLGTAARTGKKYFHLGKKTSKNLFFRTLSSPAHCHLRRVRTPGFFDGGKTQETSLEPALLNSLLSLTARGPSCDLLVCSGHGCFFEAAPHCGATAYVHVLEDGLVLERKERTTATSPLRSCIKEHVHQEEVLSAEICQSVRSWNPTPQLGQPSP